MLRYSSFSRRLAHLLRYPLVRSTSCLPLSVRGFSNAQGTSLVPVFPFPGQALHPCPCSSDNMEYRNLHLLSIGYAFRPRLRSRLTQGRSALPWKPRIFGQQDSHLLLATHSGILTPIQSTAASAATSPRIRRSPTTHCCIPSFGFMLSPVIFSAQGHSTSELLRTLLMNGCF